MIDSIMWQVPQDMLNAKLDQIYCKTCERYLPSIEFQVSSSSAKVGKCRSCKNLENLAIKRVDYTKFKVMVQRIQRDEQKYGQDSRICFLLTVSQFWIYVACSMVLSSIRRVAENFSQNKKMWYNGNTCSIQFSVS